MRLTQKSLENAALYYLQRYAATRAGLRQVLLRKIKRVREASPEQVKLVQAMVDPLIERYVAAGLVNDKVFAEARASSLRRRGGSARSIAAKLGQKGVDKATISEVIGSGGANSELEAARELCRRKRLGRDPASRTKDIAKLARAGFRYAVITAALAACARGQPNDTM